MIGSSVRSRISPEAARSSSFTTSCSAPTPQQAALLLSDRRRLRTRVNPGRETLASQLYLLCRRSYVWPELGSHRHGGHALGRDCHADRHRSSAVRAGDGASN